VETAVIIVVVVLWVLGSLVPTGHTLPQEMARLKMRQRLCLPYTEEDIKIIYRIWATWRVETLPSHTDALTQHFEAIKGIAPYYRTRRIL